MAVRGTSWSNLKLVSAKMVTILCKCEFLVGTDHVQSCFFQMQGMGEFKDIGQ